MASTSDSNHDSSSSTVQIHVVNSPEDFSGIFNCTAQSFGAQTGDKIWLLHHAGWETSEGFAAGVKGMESRWRNVKTNKFGQPNTVFLKATVDGKIAGMAIWQQVSYVEGWGDVPSEKEEPAAFAAEKLSPAERKYATQLLTSLHARRRAVAQEKARTEPEKPAIYVLDMCAVDPAFQRRGIAGKLVQWGLDEAERRGGLECTTEASVMGRPQYLKKGFRMEEGAEKIEYEVDGEFEGWARPSNVFLRTGA
jgi:GNAT superfamily N-acetyltransferase